MNISRFARTLAITVALSVPFAAVAYAGPSANARAAREDGGNRHFPMAAAEFRQHVAAKIEKTRARMEEHIASQNLPQDQADALRARFTAAVAQVNAKVDEVCADGTVTQDEAHAVHELAKSLWHHRHDG